MTSQTNSTATDSVFSIPHIIASISQGLSYHDLTNCVRVCHDWNRIFSFEFLRRDNGQGHFRSVLRIQGGRTQLKIVSRSLRSTHRMTQQEILAQNNRISEQMEWDENIFARMQSLRSYVSDDDGPDSDSDTDDDDQDEAQEDGSSDAARLNNSRMSRILNNRILPYTLMKLCWLGRDVAPVHWSRNIMLDQVLGLMSDTVLDLDLRLVYDIYSGAHSHADVDPPLPASFPKRIGRRRALTSLALTMETNFGSIGDAMDRFLQECPELRRLSLDLTGMDVDTVELSRLVKKSCPKLTELAFKGRLDLDAITILFPLPENLPTVSDLDTDLQGMMAASGAREGQQRPLQQQVLRSFSYTDTHPNDQSHSLINTLQGCWSTLESIEIDGLRIVSNEIEMFLTRCPRLEYLSINATYVDTEFISVLSISSFRPSKPWACLGLKSICLEIEDGCEYYGDCRDWNQNLDPSDRTPHSDVLSVYRRLSELTALESIQLGFSHCDSVRRRTAKSDLGFDFSLASGLHLLTTLKSLKKLTFFEFEEDGHWMIPEIGQAEVEWMAEHWTGLQEIKLNIQRPEEGSAGAEQWRRLKEARPDINVRFAV